MSCDLSFVTLPAEQARALAEKKIVRIDELRDEERKEFIAKELERRNSSRLRQFFGFRPVTEEDVVAADEAQGFFGELGFISVRYSTQRSLCLRVIAASRLAPTVNISLEDLWSIS